MRFTLHYFSSQVLAIIDRWPAAVLADYARFVEAHLLGGGVASIPWVRRIRRNLYEAAFGGRESPYRVLFTGAERGRLRVLDALSTVPDDRRRTYLETAGRRQLQWCRQEPAWGAAGSVPVPHDHEAFLARAHSREGFAEAYAALADSYLLATEFLSARLHAGLTQEQVAHAMHTTKSAVSRLEACRSQSPSLETLRRYAEAVGCHLDVRLAPLRTDAVAPADPPPPQPPHPLRPSLEFADMRTRKRNAPRSLPPAE